MSYETILSFAIGAAAALVIGFLFSLKTKGLLGLLFNTAAGGLLLTILSIFTPLNLPLNPLNALLCGVLGVPAVGLILLVVYVL